MLRGFDLLFVAVELINVNVDDHSREIDVDIGLKISTGCDVCNVNEIDGWKILEFI